MTGPKPGPAVHYRSLNGGSDVAACGLRRVPEERLTADLDLVTCGNCTGSVTWRADWSARENKRSYHEEYGPGGNADRAGRTRPNTATTAAQARASLEEALRHELQAAAGLGRKGAGDDIIAIAVRDRARTLMGWADYLAVLVAEEHGAGSQTVAYDLSDPDTAHVLTQALEDYASRAGMIARSEGGSFTRWAEAAEEMRAQAEAAG
jgi:hypothetical protein